MIKLNFETRPDYFSLFSIFSRFPFSRMQIDAHSVKSGLISRFPPFPNTERRGHKNGNAYTCSIRHKIPHQHLFTHTFLSKRLKSVLEDLCLPRVQQLGVLNCWTCCFALLKKNLNLTTQWTMSELHQKTANPGRKHHKNKYTRISLTPGFFTANYRCRRDNHRV